MIMSFREFGQVMESIDDIVLESESVTTTTDGVDAPDPQPIARTFKRGKFMGHPTIEVDDDTYSKCIQGKQPFARWSKYVQDEDLRSEMRSMFQRSERMLMVNNKNGAMAFVR